jgi:Condensation domain
MTEHPKDLQTTPTVPITHAQGVHWSRMTEGSVRDPLNLRRSIRIRGELDLERFFHSIRNTYSQHDALHLSFKVNNGQLYQSVAEKSDAPIELLSITEPDIEQRAKAAASAIAHHATLPVNIGEPPLVRFLIIRFDSDDHAFAIIVHHLIGDMITLEKLHARIAQIYADKIGLQDEPAALPFLKYAELEIIDKKIRYARHSSFWLEQLEKMPSGPTSLFDGSEDIHDYGARTLPIALGAEMLTSLRAYSAKNNVSIFCLCLTSLAIALREIVKHDTVSIGTLVSRRSSLALRNAIGCYASDLPVNVTMQGESLFREVLQDVNSTLYKIYRHQDVPIGSGTDEVPIVAAPVAIDFVSQKSSRFDFHETVEKAEKPLVATTLESPGPIPLLQFQALLFVQEKEDVLNASLIHRRTIGHRADLLAKLFKLALQNIVSEHSVVIRDVINPEHSLG